MFVGENRLPSRDPAADVVHAIIFHVTMTPMDKVYERCQQNATQGMRAFLLVPEEFVQASKVRVRERQDGRTTVQSIESFVGQNVEEIATFSEDEPPPRSTSFSSPTTSA